MRLKVFSARKAEFSEANRPNQLQHCCLRRERLEHYMPCLTLLGPGCLWSVQHRRPLLTLSILSSGPKKLLSLKSRLVLVKFNTKDTPAMEQDAKGQIYTFLMVTPTAHRGCYVYLAWHSPCALSLQGLRGLLSSLSKPPRC